jgi:hypothetical protein
MINIVFNFRANMLKQHCILFPGQFILLHLKELHMLQFLIP